MDRNEFMNRPNLRISKYGHLVQTKQKSLITALSAYGDANDKADCSKIFS